MTLEESKEVIPMMEAMITQIEEQQNIMAEMLQEIQEKDEKLMCFQEQEERLQQLESELSELLSNLAGYRRTVDAFWKKRQTRYRSSQTKISNGRNWHRN